MHRTDPLGRRRVPLHRLAWIVLAIGLMLVACGQQAGQSVAATIAAVEATSATSFLVTFNQPVGTGADDPNSYVITSSGGAVLRVIGAYPDTEDRSKVLLTTEPQSPVAYSIVARGLVLLVSGRTVDVIEGGAPVRGSTTPAPHVASAVPLDPTRLLVAFGDAGRGTVPAMADDALDPSLYEVLDPGLEIRSAAFPDADRSRVLLTTSPMSATEYRIALGPVSSDDGRPLDPVRRDARFTGIALDDTSPPTILEAYATDNTTVRIVFDEPVRDSAVDPTRYLIVDSASAPLSVTNVDLAVFGTQVALTTEPMTPDATYTVTTVGILDPAGNEIPQDVSATFGGVAAGGDDGTPPRVTGATSTASTRVIVTFSEPVRGGPSGAENVDFYDIIGSDTLEGSLSTQAIVDVVAAELSSDARSVMLTTRAQSEIAYTLRVVGVQDLAGNTLAGVDRDNPFEIEFFGTAGDATDCDADGLSDAAEQRGWTVTIVEVGGARVSREVTSDPCDADGDTDDDGLLDIDERRYRTDPRAADSDADGLSDTDELNLIYSEPTQVDTDGDELPDGLEVETFGTSPLFADTDGDQFDDGYEVTTDNRHPLIADLPRVDIEVGNVDLQLDVRFDRTTSEGTTTVDTRSVSTTLERSESSRRESVNTDQDEWTVNARASLCWLAGCQQDTFAIGGEVEVSGGFTRTSTTSSTNESARASQEAFESSLTTEAAVTAESTITRVVEDASLAVAVTISNPGNVAYTVRDIEITALTQDGRDPNTLVPVATLVSSTANEISIGPLTPSRGPFRFVAVQAFPSLVEQLMQNPRGIVFRIANYTLEDEFGRRFAFVQQDVDDRTAQLKINYAGNRPLELYQVATNGTFDPSGRSEGVSLASVLENVLGLEYVDPARDMALNPAVAADAELIARSYSTRVTDQGVERLHRIRDVSYLIDSNRDWWVVVYDDFEMRIISPVSNIPGSDFRTTTVRSDQAFGFYFVQDLDDDGLQKSIEATYGSVDSDADVCDNSQFGTTDDLCPGQKDDKADSKDSDRDGIEDATELQGQVVNGTYRPWLVRFDDGRDAYATASNPARADTDGDGLTDCQELVPTTDGTPNGTPAACATIKLYRGTDGRLSLVGSGTPDISLTLPSRTDPASPDTDGDGLTDLQEVLGYRYIGLDDQLLVIEPSGTEPATNPVDRDTDDDNLADRSEILLRSNPTVNDGDTVFDDDGDGLVNLQETTNRIISIDDYWFPNSGLADRDAVSVSTSPDDPDTDFDGLTDWEEYYGCRDADRNLTCDPGGRTFRPTGSADTDNDGLTDLQEVDGVEFTPGDGSVELRLTDPVDGDSDDDGIRDGQEILEPWSVIVAGLGGYNVWSDPLAADADGDGLNDAQERALGTDPNLADTDGDGALDGLEVNRGAVNTDPLTPDHLVTVTYLSVQAGKDAELASGDGDPDNGSTADNFGAGDFWFSMGVIRPFTEFGRTVLEPDYFVDPSGLNWRLCTNIFESHCKQAIGVPNNELWTIQVGAPATSWLRVSKTFAVPFTSAFALAGTIMEIDTGSSASEIVNDYTFTFGGLGSDGEVFEAGSLTKGTTTRVFTQTVGTSAPYRVDVSVQVTIE